MTGRTVAGVPVELAPAAREVVAALETVAAGGRPPYLVAATLERGGRIADNPARHRHDHRADEEVWPGVWRAACRCGWQAPPRGAATALDDEEREAMPGEVWAAAAVDVHAAAANAGVPVWILTPAGRRLLEGARRFGVPVAGGAR